MLFRKNYDGVFLRCLEQEDAKVVAELHDGPARGHFSGDTTTHKILRARYYWTTLFRDAHAHVRKCDTCQRSVRKCDILVLVVFFYLLRVWLIVKFCFAYGSIKQHDFWLYGVHQNYGLT